MSPPIEPHWVCTACDRTYAAEPLRCECVARALTRVELDVGGMGVGVAKIGPKMSFPRNDAPPDDGQPPDTVRVVAVGERNLEDLGLSMRARNALSWNGVTTLEQLAQTDFLTVRITKNIGRGTLEEIRRLLHKHGMRMIGDAWPEPK